jgi:glucoamylase
MSEPEFVNAQTRSASPATRARPQVALAESDFAAVAQHMFSLMLRNVASDGFPFSDPAAPGSFSKPGCVIAAPSYPANTPGVDQDYVFNWTRDAAITALELVAANVPSTRGSGAQPLIDYVTFAEICQDNATPTMGHACYTVGGESRPWSEQNDGPAIQSIAMLAAFDQLDAATQAIATTVIAKNIEYLLAVYQDPTTNLWEEHLGYSFFTRAVQLRCFAELTSNTHGIPVPAATAGAMDWLHSALLAHWNGSYYVTLLAPPAPGVAGSPTVPPEQGYDPNIDIVQASVYGAIPCTDTKLLATAGRLRRQWANSSSPTVYPINVADERRGIGPMFGRYPGDSYDGDSFQHVVGGHPWALCTCNFAELYYCLANEIAQSLTVPFDDHSQEFFEQVGITDVTTAKDAVGLLRDASDALLQAVIYHSDHLELSEQFDGSSGYEKSVRDLTVELCVVLVCRPSPNRQGRPRLDLGPCNTRRP